MGKTKAVSKITKAAAQKNRTRKAMQQSSARKAGPSKAGPQKGKRSAGKAKHVGELPEKYMKILRRLNNPFKMQEYIDNMPYKSVDHYPSVLQTMQDGATDCFGGAIIGAYCCQLHGYGPAMIIGMDANEKIDDGHAVCAYKKNGLWGSIAQSNYTGVRGRDPVYRTVRELMISYWDFYVNKDGIKTLICHSDAVNLDKVDPKREWVHGTHETAAEKVSDAIDICPFKFLPKQASMKDMWTLKGKVLGAQLYGTNMSQVFGNHD